MGQPPQTPSQHAQEQLYYLVPNTQSLDLSAFCEEMDNLDLQAHHHPWIMATMIEDDDLQFGGKPLSSWYEEDRRRCSMGEDSAPSPGFLEQVTRQEAEEEAAAEEEKRRGRTRERPHYRSARAAEQKQQKHHHHHHHHHHHTKPSKPLTAREVTNQ